MSGRLAWWVRPVNGLLAPAASRGRSSPGRSFAALGERAARRTGLPERADREFLDGLRVLHESFLAVPELSFTGLEAVRAELLRQLCNRLRVRAYLRAHPQVSAVPVARPVFVTGLPRSGTTALHALLAGLPGHRAPLMWELLAPCPPDDGRPGPDPRLRSAERLARLAQHMAPALRVIHPLDARAPEECVLALPHSMVHYTRARIPGYRDWYAGRDATADYAYLRQQLQILQWEQPARRWILKSPFHLWQLDALLRVFPDASIVWTHRDPAAALASWCSLSEATRRLHNRRVDLPLLGRDWLGLWAEASMRATRARARAAAPFLDVAHAELAADPLRALEPVLSGLGVEPAPADRGRIAAAARPPGPAAPGAHRYSLARYGLTPQSVRDAFPASPVLSRPAWPCCSP